MFVLVCWQIRALLLHTRIQDTLPSHENSWWRKQDLESASVALMNTRAELNSLAATISVRRYRCEQDDTLMKNKGELTISVSCG
jgi:hypothetical protein